MWNQYLLDDRSLKAIYGEDLPNLERVSLYEIKIVNGADLDCILAFNLATLPHTLPRKWIDKGVNTVRVDLNLIAAEVTYFESSGGDQIGNIIISQQGDRILVGFAVENRQVFTMTAKWIRLG